MGSRGVWSAVTLEYVRAIAGATVPVKYLQYPTRLTKQAQEMMKRYDHVRFSRFTPLRRA
jgi:type VI protein secretion system component VasF